MKYFTTTISAVLFSFALIGTANAASLNYNYLNLNYVSNTGGGVTTGTGIGVDGSYGISDNMNLYFGYQAPSFTAGTVSEAKFGVGYHDAIADGQDWYVKADGRSFDFFGSSITGFTISGGMRMSVNSQFEWDGYVGYGSYSGGGGSNSDVLYGIDGVYKINDQWGVNFGLMKDAVIDWDGWKIGARMYF